MEGGEHGLRDFHASSKETLTYECWSVKDVRRRRRRFEHGGGGKQVVMAMRKWE